MSVGKLTIKCTVKESWWFKALQSVLICLENIKVIDGDTAIKIVCKAASKGYKYKLGNSKWKSFNREIVPPIKNR
jgi:hypothetical protein